MAIVISHSPKLEARLLQKALQQGQDINSFVSQLLTTILEWEIEDSAEAITGIQQGLDNFEAGKFCSFEKFAQKQRTKYKLLTDS